MVVVPLPKMVAKMNRHRSGRPTMKNTVCGSRQKLFWSNLNSRIVRPKVFMSLPPPA
jgi:hypothetical protein